MLDEYKSAFERGVILEQVSPAIRDTMANLEISDECKTRMLEMRDKAHEVIALQEACYEHITDPEILATVASFIAGQHYMMANSASRVALNSTRLFPPCEPETFADGARERQEMLAAFMGDRFSMLEQGLGYSTPVQRAQYAQRWLNSVEGWAQTLRQTRNKEILAALRLGFPVKRLAALLGVSRAYINKVRAGCTS